MANYSDSYILGVSGEESYRHPQYKFAMMKSQQKIYRYGVSPQSVLAGEAPGPLPRRDPPQSTGRKNQRTGNAIHTSGKQKLPDYDNTNSKSGDSERKLDSTFNIAQFNICGLSTKKLEFENFLPKNRIKVALLQETQHVEDTNLNITGYTPYPCDCKDCQGAITYVRNDVTSKVENITTSQPTIIQKVEIWHTECNFTLYNLYNPPRNKMELTRTFHQTQFNKSIIAGDFNGHSPAWGYDDEDATGRYIETLCNTTNLTMMQDKTTPPTHFHRVHRTLSRPDLTLVSADFVQKVNYKVTDGIGSSDHFPIILEIQSASPKKFEQRTRWNFKKAKWDRYKTTTNVLLQEIDPEDADINKTAQRITDAILKAANQCIPRGSRVKYKPFWNKKIDQAVKAREEARKRCMKNPTVGNKIELNRTTAVARKETLTAKREKFRTTCENIDLHREGNKT